MTPTRKVAVSAFLLGSVVAGGISLATLGNASAAPATTATTVAADDTDSSTPATDSAAGDQPAGAQSANGTTEEELSGDTAASVEAAVAAAYPDATIERLETDAEGAAYEAHLTLADGSRATVKLDASFAITSTETGRGDHGGAGGAPHAANGVTEEELSGDEAAGVKAAVLAAYPDATIERMETDAEGSAYEAHITLGNGSKTTIKLDSPSSSPVRPPPAEEPAVRRHRVVAFVAPRLRVTRPSPAVALGAPRRRTSTRAANCTGRRERT